jgi:hypothetical protein
MKKIFLVFSILLFVPIAIFATEDNNANYLGLPTSTRWCDHNVGTTNYLQYGNYFQWGKTETVGQYTSSTYDASTITAKNIEGIIANDAPMKDEQPWYKMPTKEMFQELIDKCKWTWSDDDKVYYVTAPNGTTIVLPAAGYKDGRNAVGEGTEGYYWTANVSETDETKAYCLHFTKDKREIITMSRYYGMLIRPVIPGFLFDESNAEMPVPFGQSNCFCTLNISTDEDVWTTFCVPFIINNEGTNCVFSDIISAAAKFTGIKDGVAQFETISEDDGIISGVPYLVQFSETKNNTMGNRIIDKPVAQNTTVGDYIFQGNYIKTKIPANSYSFDGKNFVKAGSDAEINGYTAWMTCASSTSEKIKVAVDGKILDTSTGVNIINTDVSKSVNVYNMQGVAVRKNVKASNALIGLSNGIYIVNGKKVVK